MSDQPETGEASTTAQVGLGSAELPEGGADTYDTLDDGLAADAPPPPEPDPEPAAEPDPADPQQVTLRRAPRYRAFVVTGVLLGFVLSLVLVGLFPDSSTYSTGTVLGYVAAALGLLGGVLGAGLALIVERPRR